MNVKTSVLYTKNFNLCVLLPRYCYFVVSQYVSVRQLRNQRNQGSHRKSENSKPDQQKTEKMELNQENSGKISDNYFTGP